MKLILASASPRRSELLRSMGVQFEVMPSRAEELHDENLSAAELCELNAQRKAEDIARRYPDAVVLGADTLVALGRRIYGKPMDRSAAKQMLRELSANTHEVVTGLCLVHHGSRRQAMFHESTLVTFKTLADESIEAYINAVNVLDKAGAYGIQERGEILVERIAGSFSNVVGLPIECLAKHLDTWDIPHQFQRAIKGGGDKSDVIPE